MKPQITLASACVAIAIICVGVGAAAEWGGPSGRWPWSRYWLRHTRKSRRSVFVLCLGVALATFAAAFVLHI